MIHILIKDSQQLRTTKSSGFVSFAYNPEIVEVVKSLPTRVYDAATRTWEIPLTSIANLCNKLNSFEVVIDGKYTPEKQLNAQLPTNFEFKTKPYKHQIDGVMFGLEHDSFLLGDDQGLGKTKEIIDLAVIKKHRDGMKHCLIICGVNGVKYNWQEEIQIHSDEKSWVLGTRFRKRSGKAYEGEAQDKLDDLTKLPKDFFIITNIETLRLLKQKDGKSYKYPIAQKINQLCRMGEIGMIAFDEAHKAANPTSHQGRAILTIQADSFIPMSGTFLMNNPLDLYMPLRLAGYEDHSYYTYSHHYCVYGGFSNGDVVGYKNLSDLQGMLAEVMIRRKKADVLDLPPKVHSVEYVDMTPAQAKIYEDVERIIKKDIDKIRLSNDPLAMLIRLRQATGWTGILSTTVAESAKMTRMEEIIEDIVANGEKCVVFSQWEQITAVVRSKLSKYNPAYVTGNTKDRIAEIEKFQNNSSCKVIIGTIGALGTGFTLTAANNVIFMDEPWNRALKDQAEDRAHRIGTKGTVRIITLVCKDTIDERIMSLVAKKGKMADLLIDGKMEIINRSAFVNFMLT